jgi:hypothetical protein
MKKSVSLLNGQQSFITVLKSGGNLQRSCATSRKIVGSIPDKVIEFLLQFTKSFQPHYMTLRLTQPLTEMSKRNLSRVKVWPARRADNPNAICEPTV